MPWLRQETKKAVTKSDHRLIGAPLPGIRELRSPRLNADKLDGASGLSGFVNCHSEENNL